MALPSAIKALRAAVNETQTAQITSKMGRASLVRNQLSKKGVARVRKLALFLAIFNAYGRHAQGALNFRARKVKREEQKEMRAIGQDFKTAVSRYAFIHLMFLNPKNLELNTNCPSTMEVEGTRITSSSGMATALAHMSKLLIELDNGKDDIVLKIARDAFEAVQTSYYVIQMGLSDRKVGELPNALVEWSEKLELTMLANYVAPVDNTAPSNVLAINSAKSAAPEFETQEAVNVEGLVKVQNVLFLNKGKGDLIVIS